MNFSELQKKWNQQEDTVNSMIKLNNTLLSRAVTATTKSRIGKGKINLIFQFVISIVIVGFFALSVRFRVPGLLLYSGLLTFLLMIGGLFYRYINYYRMLKELDFSGRILSFRKQVNHLSRYRLNTIKFGYMSTPFAFAAITLLVNTDKDLISTFFLPLFLLISVASIVRYLVIRNQFKQLEQKLSQMQEADNLL